MLDRLLVNVEEGSEPLALLEKAARLALSGGQLELFCCVSRSPAEPMNRPPAGPGTH